MKSHEVLRDAISEPGVKSVAASLKVSPALVYKWCEAAPTEADTDQSGTRNPLDRVRDIYLLTKDIRIVRWLCNEAGGFFVSNPVPDIRRSVDQHIYDDTRKMFREFSELLDAITESVNDDQHIDAEEAEIIRDRWEDLKAVLEQFVVSCEQGHFHLKEKPKK
ncbi:MAG: hypothetical protein QM770_17855 [Tepidisphaeraceae bacterium]